MNYRITVQEIGLEDLEKRGKKATVIWKLHCHNFKM